MNQLTNLFKLMSDETRLRALNLLFEDKLCVCEMTECLSLPQPKISKALSKLKDNGLVTDIRKDKFVIYQLTNEPDLLYILEYIRTSSTAPQLKEDIRQLASVNRRTL